MARSKTANLERQPSKVTDDYWIEARRKVADYPEYTDRGGKWLVFRSMDQLDEVWGHIRQAVEEGRLGNAAKVSTARPNPNGNGADRGIICVYSYDWTDEQDVKRIREELRALGITGKIPYKSDDDTLEGKYANRGNRRISKYYE